ncbi:MAG TPA: DarT ssDNA thymidine ADP-ribosyltransferase family protein [Methylomirabilota bacterium]|nr:DarT ssDNA thymidine ADP-ribosyltransferase family protein [Methylomirabilota bacterium]
MAYSLHPDANAILVRLKREGITALYHFTSVENLHGICQMQALCSKQTLENERRRLPLVTGGNPLSHSLDRSRGNWNKVSLNLTSHTPMVYHRKREQHLCFFVISPEVATWSGVVFTDANAASNTHRREEGLAGLNNINFEAIRALPRPGDRDGWVRPVQAEVLVPDRIPLEHVSHIAFVSKASMSYAEHLCYPHLHPKFLVDSQLFADFSISSKWTVDFSYVLEMILTDAKIEENVVNLSYVHMNKFSKDSDCATLIAKVRAMAGTLAKVLFQPANMPRITREVIETTEFAISSQYYHWHSIPLEDLPYGVYIVEYHLDNICRASTEFEVVQ